MVAQVLVMDYLKRNKFSEIANSAFAMLQLVVYSYKLLPAETFTFMKLDIRSFEMLYNKDTFQNRLSPYI